MDNQTHNTDEKKKWLSAENALKSIGLTSFRNRQLEFIQEILEDRQDRIFCLPTAYGKSLIYIVPTIALHGVSLIISPLVSLIQDQCAKLNTGACKIAFNLSSSCDAEDKDEVMAFSEEAKRSKTPMLLFCTPEKVTTANFQTKLRNMHASRGISFFVLDEAHLIEQGHSFRKDYLQLDFLRKQYDEVPILCFSATCSEFSQRQLRQVLFLRNPVLVTEKDQKENMNLEIHYVSKKKRACSCRQKDCSWIHGGANLHERLQKSLAHASGGSTLITTNSKKDCECLYEESRALFPAKVVGLYHGSLSDNVRAEIQKNFVNGSIDILIATWASFGTGVDMPALTRVILFGVPMSFYTFIQTIGRAGRAGQECFIHVYVSEADLVKQRAVLKKEMASMSGSKSYGFFLQRSFSMMQSVLNKAIQGDVCILRLTNSMMYDAPQTLSVPFSSLAKFKAVNAKIAASERARWDAERRSWVLHPTCFHANLVPYGAKRVHDAQFCNKCSSCIFLRPACAHKS